MRAAAAPRRRATRRPQTARPRVLFACTWNATRSPMAQALAAAHFARLGLAGAAVSAGVAGAGPLDPLAVAAMREIGLDIAAHAPATLDDLERRGDDLGAYDLIVALSEPASVAAERIARHAAGPVAVERWAIDDPTRVDGDEAARLAAYRRVRDALAEAIAARFGSAAG